MAFSCTQRSITDKALLFQVMFRMNFLVVMLCFVMNRPYQFYYFVPLVSFWFVIMYLTMAIWPHITSASAEGKNSCSVLGIEACVNFLIFMGLFFENFETLKIKMLQIELRIY